MSEDGPDKSGLSAAGGTAGRPDHDQVLAALRTLNLDHMNRMRIRAQLAEELCGTDIGRLRDNEILKLVASRLISGALGLVPIPLAPAPVGPAHPRQEAEPEETGVAAAVVQEPSTRNAIKLIDEDDQPVPDVDYRLKLPSGRIREGRLNAQGMDRVVLSQGGACGVCFPKLDGNAWAPVT